MLLLSLRSLIVKINPTHVKYNKAHNGVSKWRMANICYAYHHLPVHRFVIKCREGCGSSIPPNRTPQATTTVFLINIFAQVYITARNSEERGQLEIQCFKYVYKKMWNMHTMDYYSVFKKKQILTFAAIWLNLEDTMLSKVSQKSDTAWFHL